MLATVALTDDDQACEKVGHHQMIGAEHVVFTGNVARVPGLCNPAVGLMTRKDGLYLFFPTHDVTVSPGVVRAPGLRSACGSPRAGRRDRLDVCAESHA
jgi:hypothetical protein